MQNEYIKDVCREFSKFLAASYNASALCILSQFIPNESSTDFINRI